MKIRFLVFGLLIITASAFNSCKKDSLLTKDIYVTLSSDFVVAQAASTSWDESKLLDAAAQSSELETYKDVIENVSLDKVTYTITANGGPAGQVLTNGFIDVADAAGGGRLNLSTMQNVNIPAALNVETQVPVAADATIKLVDLIKNTPHQAMIYSKGTVNAAPIDMTVKVKLYLTVKVKLL